MARNQLLVCHQEAHPEAEKLVWADPPSEVGTPQSSKVECLRGTGRPQALGELGISSHLPSGMAVFQYFHNQPNGHNE